jgi:hypothetical protein
LSRKIFQNPQKYPALNLCVFYLYRNNGGKVYPPILKINTAIYETPEALASESLLSPVKNIPKVIPAQRSTHLNTVSSILGS